MIPEVSVSKAAANRFLPEVRHQAACCFWSSVGNNFGLESEIDLLVVFESDRIPSLLGVGGMELGLSELFAGRKVDLRTAEDLSPLLSAACSRHGGSSICA